MRICWKLGQVKCDASVCEMSVRSASDTPGIAITSKALATTVRRQSTRGLRTNPTDSPAKHGQTVQSGVKMTRSVPTTCSSASATGTHANEAAPTSSCTSGCPAIRTSKSSTISEPAPRVWHRTPLTLSGVEPSEKRVKRAQRMGVPCVCEARIGLSSFFIVSSVATSKNGQYLTMNAFIQSARCACGRRAARRAVGALSLIHI